MENIEGGPRKRASDGGGGDATLWRFSTESAQIGAGDLDKKSASVSASIAVHSENGGEDASLSLSFYSWLRGCLVGFRLGKNELHYSEDVAMIATSYFD